MTPRAPRFSWRGPRLLSLAALALVACRSQPETGVEKAPVAHLELKPRKSSFRDIGKRGDSDLGVGRDAR